MKRAITTLFTLVAIAVMAGIAVTPWTSTTDRQTACNAMLGSATTGQLMRYNGTSWVPVSPQSGQFYIDGFSNFAIKPGVNLTTPSVSGAMTQVDGATVETHSFYTSDITSGTSQVWSYPYDFNTTYNFDVLLAVRFDDSSPEGSITARYTISANTDIDSVFQVSVSPATAVSQTTAGAASGLTLSVGDDGAGNFTFTVSGVPTAVLYQGVVQVFK